MLAQPSVRALDSTTPHGVHRNLRLRHTTMSRQRPRLRNGVDLQLQSAFQEGNWPVAIRLAEKRWRTFNDQYFEVREGRTMDGAPCGPGDLASCCSNSVNRR